MHLADYVPNPFSRPSFRADGVIVCRRAFPSVDDAFVVGDVVPSSRFANARELAIYWEQGLVDTLAPPTPKADAKKPVAPQRGR